MALYPYYINIILEQSHKISKPTEINFSLSEPCLCLCLRGQKHFYINQKSYIQSVGDYVLTATTLPINADIVPKNGAYTSIRIDLAKELIVDVINKSKLNPPKHKCYCGLNFNKSSKELEAVVARLLKEPLSEGGLQFGVSQALMYLRQNYASKLNMSSVAKLSGLSERSFYDKFKVPRGKRRWALCGF